MASFRLPVSSLDVQFRQPTGVEDVLLVEETPPDVRLALIIVDAIGRLPDGEAVPWASLSVTDLDAALLAIRRIFIGGQIRTSTTCTAVERRGRRLTGHDQTDESTTGCRARIEIAFRIDDYLAHHAPVPAREVIPANEPGWFQLQDMDVTGRLVSVADQIDILDRSSAEHELVQRCIRPPDVSLRIRRRLEAAMAKLAPSLYDELEGLCPECGSIVRIPFDPQRYVLAELRERAVFVFEEVHLIAARYRWSEREILALPRSRRSRYAEFVHETDIRR